MLATITKVGIEKAPKGYTIANVTYLRDGQEKNAKIMSFAYPEAFAAVEKIANQVPVDVNVTMEKKGQYWNWKGVEVGGKAPATDTAKPAGKVLGSNYETPAERARRQVYIVRQSSIASAIEYFKGRDPKGITVSPQEILDTAKVFEEFVMDVPAPADVQLPE